jgi:hypothetical protein
LFRASGINLAQDAVDNYYKKLNEVKELNDSSNLKKSRDKKLNRIK